MRRCVAGLGFIISLDYWFGGFGATPASPPNSPSADDANRSMAAPAIDPLSDLAMAIRSLYAECGQK